MYRLRTPDTHKPLFISNGMIQDYSENRVDTLHVKNLLHLGEDRYLTTLLLKHFPNFKTSFVRDAQAQTVAPENWNILLSQRRRWINSTVHNLAELVFLERLCGFCCFSMRFIVFIDLLSTVIQPVTIAYVSIIHLFLCRLMESKHFLIDRIPCLPGSFAAPVCSHTFSGHDWCHLWSPSSHFHFPTEMGYDRMDDLLYPSHPRVFVLASTIRFLEDG